MRIVIAGGHGQIAMLLHPRLIDRGHEVCGLIRNPDHTEDVLKTGAQPVVCDLEKIADVSEFISAADALIFAAGAGPGSGAARKLSMDRDGAIKLIQAATHVGVRRFIMISAMNPEEPRGDKVFRVYLQAKADADRALRESDLDYLIVRPGRLTNQSGSGRVSLAETLPRADISRSDVAELISRLVDNFKWTRLQFDVTSGPLPIGELAERGLPK